MDVESSKYLQIFHRRVLGPFFTILAIDFPYYRQISSGSEISGLAALLYPTLRKRI